MYCTAGDTMHIILNYFTLITFIILYIEVPQYSGSPYFLLNSQRETRKSVDSFKHNQTYDVSVQFLIHSVACIADIVISKWLFVLKLTPYNQAVHVLSLNLIYLISSHYTQYVHGRGEGG